jgi:hypothetical protein
VGNTLDKSTSTAAGANLLDKVKIQQAHKPAYLLAQSRQGFSPFQHLLEQKKQQNIESLGRLIIEACP